MSDSNDNFRNPYTEDPENHDTIASLVRGAYQTRRQPPEASTRKHPRYPSENKRAARKITLDMDPEVIAALRAIPEELGAKKRLSAVSQALIEYALEAYHSGRIELKPRVGSRGICFDAEEVDDNGD